jgi:hypothetical protein
MATPALNSKPPANPHPVPVRLPVQHCLHPVAEQKEPLQQTIDSSVVVAPGPGQNSPEPLPIAIAQQPLPFRLPRPASDFAELLD